MARLNTRVTEDVHRRVKVQAVLSGRSMEDVVQEALESWLHREEMARLAVELMGPQQKEEKQA